MDPWLAMLVLLRGCHLLALVTPAGWANGLAAPAGGGQAILATWNDPQMLAAFIRDIVTHPLAVASEGGHAHHQ
jgi:hypothetical protein